MKRLKLFFACLLMAVLSIGQMWGAIDANSTWTATAFGDLPDGATVIMINNFGNSFANATVTKAPAKVAASFNSTTKKITVSTEGKSLDDIAWTVEQATNGTKFWVYGSTTNLLGLSKTNDNNAVAVNTTSNASYNEFVMGSNGKLLKYYNAGRYVGEYVSGSDWRSYTTENANNYKSGTTEQALTFYVLDENEGPLTPTCATPTFDPASGEIFSDDIDVEIACATDGVTIYYTTDGEDPTTSSDVYTTALNFTETTTLKAMAIKAGYDNSAVATATYTKVVPFSGSILEIVKDDFTTSSYDDNAGDHEKSGITFTTAKVYQSGGGIQFQKTNGLLYNKTDLGEIAKIEITTVSGKSNNLVVYSGTTENPTSGAVTGSTSGSVTTYTFAAGKGFFAIKCNSTGASNVDPIKIYYTSSASSVAKPTISGTDNFLSTTEVTISIPDGATVYYTTDGSDPKSGSTYSAPFTLDESATVRAIAKIGEDYSAEASKEFTKATVMTVAQALAASAGANQYVKGIISSIDEVSTGHGNATYYLKDEGQENSIKIYRGKYLNDAAFTAEDQIYEGDEVTILGTISVYDQVNQFAQGNYIVALKPAARLAWSEESYEADLSSSNTFPSLTNTNGVSVSYSSTNTDAATINPSTGAISLVAVGSTTIKATFTGNETYKANEVSYTLTVSNSVLRADISFEENGGSDVADLTDQSNLPDPLPTITKAGYNFGGWWTTSDFQDGTEAVAGDAVTSTDPITLYAKWLNPYTVTEALTMIDALADNGETGNVYVFGIVCTAPSNLISGGYLTYYISVDGTETNRLQVYKGKNVGNIAFTDKEDVQAADQVIVYGPLKKFKQGENIIPEFNTGNYLYSLSRKAEAGIEWGVASFDAYIGESNTFPTLTNPNSLTVAYSSSNETAATIDPATGAITLGTTPNVNTTITASFAGNSSYKAAEVSYTLNVYNPTNPGTITYEENGGSEVADVETPVDNLPDPLPTPTKENNIFAGWWTTSTFDENTQAVAGAPMSGDIILYAKWTEIPVWATTYTSNIALAVDENDTKAYAEKVKITVEEVLTEFPALRAATSNAAGTCHVIVPAGTQTLHFHAAAWNGKTSTLTVKMGETTLLSQALTADAGINTNSPYTLAGNAYEYYYSIDLSSYNLTEETRITFSAASGKQSVIFGVNQEGGALPVLESIEIKGDLTTKTGYKAGDALDLDGLTVEATYSLAGVNQTPVDITNKLGDGLTLTYDPLVENQTEVTITATYGDKSDDITINGLEAVASADPKIYVSTLNVNFASVEVGESVPAAETVTVTLTNVASVTATLGGTNADAFSVSPASLTESGDITISILANTNAAASYAATLTISDGEGGADDKTVNLSFEVTEPVVEDDVTGTWTLVTNATTLAAGKKVIIAQYVEADGAINTMASQSSNNRSVIASTVAGTTLTPAVGTKIMTLADAGEGNFYLKTSDGEYLYNASTSSKSYLRTKAEEENVSWTIAVDAEGVATITSVENTNRTKMRYNPNTSGSPLFNCYASGQEDIALYMLEEDAPEPPTPSYTEVRNGLTEGWYYTMCLDKAVTAVKAGSIWRVLSKAANGKDVILEEVTGTLDAGRPYIFRAAASTLEVAYTGDAVGAPVNEGNNGLVGSFTEEPLTQNTNHYIIYNNALYFVNSDNVKVGAHRAYLDMNDVPAYSNEPQQGAPRRRVVMTVHGEQTATGCENINASETPVKMIIDGQLYILRGEKMYDATGKLVK